MTVIPAVRRHAWRGRATTVLVVVATLMLFGMALVLAAGFAVNADVGCSACHTMRQHVAAEDHSSHGTLGCSSCHATPAPLGVVVDGLRAERWAVSELIGRPVIAGGVSDASCRGCHEPTLAMTVVAMGIRVRHADFVERSCTECHAGTGHRVERGWYPGVQMADCTGCHATYAANVDHCSFCHVEKAPTPRPEWGSAWRAAHGAGWERTHGMGDVSSCRDCHGPVYCARCHGTAIPHPVGWQRTHGASASDSQVRAACATCHEPSWCGECHGVQMPHPAGFLPVHGPAAIESGETICQRCHPVSECERCHLASSHPNVPGAAFGGAVHGF